MEMAVLPVSKCVCDVCVLWLIPSLNPIPLAPRTTHACCAMSSNRLVSSHTNKPILMCLWTAGNVRLAPFEGTLFKPRPRGLHVSWPYRVHLRPSGLENDSCSLGVSGVVKPEGTWRESDSPCGYIQGYGALRFF